jgi:hypothetical protein
MSELDRNFSIGHATFDQNGGAMCKGKITAPRFSDLQILYQLMSSCMTRPAILSCEKINGNINVFIMLELDASQKTKRSLSLDITVALQVVTDGCVPPVVDGRHLERQIDVKTAHVLTPD